MTIDVDPGERPPFSRPPRMSRLALGTYPLGGGYGAVDEAAARATVDAAIDAGWTFVDTAETYLVSEERLGRVLAGRRDRIFLATKAFPCESYTLEHLQTALESSLRRLGTDRVDLYQLHGPQDWVARFEDAVGIDELADALGRLVESGKALRIGVCNFDAAGLEALSARTEIFSTQNLYSLIDRGAEADPLHLPVEREIIPAASRLGMAFLAFSPLSRGLLADDLDPERSFGPDDERHFLPRYQAGAYREYVRLARALQEWAESHNETLARLAVAWTLANPGVAASLIGAKSPRHVEALAGAEEWRLDRSDLTEIDDLLATLDDEARAAKMIVWEHFSPEAFAGLCERRHSVDPELVDGLSALPD